VNDLAQAAPDALNVRRDGKPVPLLAPAAQRSLAPDRRTQEVTGGGFVEQQTRSQDASVTTPQPYFARTAKEAEAHRRQFIPLCAREWLEQRRTKNREALTNLNRVLFPGPRRAFAAATKEKSLRLSSAHKLATQRSDGACPRFPVGSPTDPRTRVAVRASRVLVNYPAVPCIHDFASVTDDPRFKLLPQVDRVARWLDLGVVLPRLHLVGFRLPPLDRDRELQGRALPGRSVERTG